MLFLQVHFYINKEGECSKEEAKNQLKALLKQLSWYTDALSSYRKKAPLPIKL